MSIKELKLSDVAIFRLTENLSIHDDRYSGIESVLNYTSKFLEKEDPSLLTSHHYCRNSIAPTPDLCFIAIYKTDFVGMTYYTLP